MLGSKLKNKATEHDNAIEIYLPFILLLQSDKEELFALQNIRLAYRRDFLWLKNSLLFYFIIDVTV